MDFTEHPAYGIIESLFKATDQIDTDMTSLLVFLDEETPIEVLVPLTDAKSLWVVASNLLVHANTLTALAEELGRVDGTIEKIETN